MKDLYGGDEVLKLRKEEEKSSGKRYYERKGYTRAFLFSVFDPTKSLKEIKTGFIIRTLPCSNESIYTFSNIDKKLTCLSQNNKDPVYIFSKSDNQLSYFKTDPIGNDKNLYLTKLFEILKSNFINSTVSADALKLIEKRLFTLFNDDLVLIIVTIEPEHLLQPLFLKEDYVMVPEKDLKNQNLNNVMVKHMNTWDNYKNKLLYLTKE
jgi:hypothetical protein